MKNLIIPFGWNRVLKTLINNQKIVMTWLLFFTFQIASANDFKILVFHKTNGWRHQDAIEASITMLEELGNNTEYDNWTVDETEDPLVFTSANLANYDVIVFSNTTGGGLLNSNQKAAMEAFIQSGKGFIGFHSATDTYRNDSPNAQWLWYNQLVGAIVQTSPNHTSNNLPGTMNVLNNHPIISHVGNVGDTWAHQEEWYYWEQNGGQLSPDNTVLLEVQTTGNQSYDATRPITWLKEFDGGRSFYTALGHNGETYESNENFREMVQKAVLWVSNRLPNEGDCATITSDWKDLLDDDLSCWEKWMGVPHSTTGLPGASDNVINGSGTPLGLNNDPTNVFSVINVDGEKQLYITGEVYGGLTTLSEYGNYHLSMQFKWGEKKWEPRLDDKKDSGILYHCKGEHGRFWDVWKSCLEFQVQEGDCADYIGLGDVGGLVPAVRASNQWVFTPKASLQSSTIVRKSENFENPDGQWNTLEVIVIGDRAIHYVNGNMVNAVVDAKWNGNTVTNGQIQIQSEAAEIYYKDIKIKAVTSFPEDDKETLGWTDDGSTVCNTNAPIGQVIALKKSGGDQKWVTIAPSSSNLIANGEEADRELFLVEAHPNGCVAFKSLSSGKYAQVIGANNDAAISAKGNAPGTWENFGWQQKGTNQVAIKSLFNNGWAQASWTEDNTSLFPKGASDGDWETFDYVIINDACDVNLPIGKTIALRKSGGDQKWVTIDSSTTNVVANGEEEDKALFTVEAHPNGCIALKSVATGKYLQVNGGNQNVEIKAKGDAPGTWENFGWKTKGDNQVAFKSLFNDGWIQASWTEDNTSLYPQGAADGSWETFDYEIIVEDNPACTSSAPVGETIALRKSGGDQKWVSIVSTSTNVIANATEAERELFLVATHPNGCISLQAQSTGKFLQVNGANQNVAIKANGNAPGTWENFDWKLKGDNKVALKSLFNNGWVQASWPVNNASLYPKGAADGTWETFDYIVVSSVVTAERSLSEQTANSEQLTLYPVPVKDFLNIKGWDNAQTLYVMDSFGRTIQTVNVVGMNETQIDASALSSGIYFIAVGDKRKIFMKK